MNSCQKCLDLKGLGEKVVSPALCERHCSLAIGRHQHNGNVVRRALAFQLLTEQSAIQASQENVQENQIRLETEKALQVASPAV